ncbi:hypothetical protein RJ640_013495 [Escallonia rubra]|uniref:Lipoxygenase n=1 Tax=Escallonia rubra TaxID=112253 RepID=A0AA88S3B8_9ASTE|nr:hypothetical protein RJ640_013495 [Escallonia rubra]
MAPWAWTWDLCIALLNGRFARIDGRGSGCFRIAQGSTNLFTDQSEDFSVEIFQRSPLPASCVAPEELKQQSSLHADLLWLDIPAISVLAFELKRCLSRKAADPVMEEEDRNRRMRYETDERRIKGTVVLMKKKNLLNFEERLDRRIFRPPDRKVSLQLISAVNGDTDAKELRGKLGKPAQLEGWNSANTPLMSEYFTFSVTFDWDEEIGVPGAFLINNYDYDEFYLKTLTLEAVPGHGRLHFICNSWTYLPSRTPPALQYYRGEELVNLRGTGTGELEESDRVYDYDLYNDLGNPDNANHLRPILGGSTEFPYPRRGRTGRPLSRKDPRCETRLPFSESLKIYVPRDERFSHFKMSDFAAYALQSIFQFLIPEFEVLFDRTPSELDTFEDLLELFEGGIPIPDNNLLESIREKFPLEMIKELLRSDGERPFKFPLPQVIKEDKSAWADEEFAREMLAGVNPVVICGLKEFPPTSKLDPKLYGNQNSSMTKEHIKDHLDGLTVDEAMENNRLFILDHHEALMPYLRQINTTSTRTYATRTLLFLKRDGTLTPLAIELSFPHDKGDQLGAVSRVQTPAEKGAEGTIWDLAKAYVAVNDSGYHQLVCHWLHTHAVTEPFIIATNRQLSVLHPVYKLLHPHFRDTMNINALGRQTLINAGGILERTVFPGKFAMEISAVMYRDWVFPEQALPADLVKRGMAVEDSKSPHGIRLLIEAYPYAVDGLKIWSAIRTWVEDYCSFYYKNDEVIQEDHELQSWWEEVKNKGHPDKKHESWWPKMQTREELVETCTIIIWITSALHEAVNVGQYPYRGYPLTRPAMSRRLIPKHGTPEYDELEKDPEKAYLKTITVQIQSILGISLIEILSKHSSDEVVLGQRDTSEWTTDMEPLKAFGRFGKRLKAIEQEITEMNKEERYKNRIGPVRMLYTLLQPSTELGLTGKGIPNSVSI